MTIEQSHIDKFAAVYAEAVLTFIDSREAQWVLWDGHSHRFDFMSVEMDEPTIPVMLHIDAAWNDVIQVDEIVDPDNANFDLDALRNAIEKTITDEGFGERLLKGFQERLQKIADGEFEPEEPPAPESDDE